MTGATFTELPPHAAVDPRQLGEFVILPGPGQRTAPEAVPRLRQVLEQQPDADVVYADEAGPGGAVLLRPDWAPEWFRHLQYTGDWCVLRTAPALELVPPSALTDPAARYDLLLRATERARAVAHVAEPLVLREPAPGEDLELPASQCLPGAADRSVRALQDHLDRIGLPARARATEEPGRYDIEREPVAGSVVVVVPTRGASGEVRGKKRCYVVEAVRSALERTAHSDVEVIVVHDANTPNDVLARLTALDPRVDLLLFDQPFNFSRKCNLAVAASRADFVVLLNDDTEAITDGWLERLLAPLREDDVGMVGARLLFEDGTIQHAGHVYRRTWVHAYAGYPADHRGELAALLVDHEYSGATAACVALRREVYERVGGLWEELPGNYNDVDLCFKLGLLGYRALGLADCRLYHFESRTRVPAVRPEELATWRRRWDGKGWSRDRFLPWESARIRYRANSG